MVNTSFNSRLIGVAILIVLLSAFYFIHSICKPAAGRDLDVVITDTESKIQHLKDRIDLINQRNSRNIALSDPAIDVTLYLITPTYYRHTQQADLFRLSHTLMHVKNLHWIVVEDSDSKTELVTNILKETGLRFTQLNIGTSKDLVRGQNDPRWKKHRGVDQRNHGLAWIRENIDKNKKAVIYFADDDNTYHLRLFEEMRTTRKVSMWPVALVGALRWEGPVCKNGKVEKFFTGWRPDRKFPIDMAAFAVNMKLLFQYPTAYINPDVERGFLETDFLQQLHISLNDLEAKANDCSKILVWHTQTAEPKMKQELRLQKLGQGSDPRIII